MHHLIDPSLLPGLEFMPRFDLSDEALPTIREGIAQMSAATPQPEGTGVSWMDEQVPAQEGHSIPVRIFTPDGISGAAPAILHIHGGGYVFGSIAMSTASNMRTAAAVQAVVVSVDYRLAPETRAPGSVEDCYAALLWLNDNAARLGVDPARIAIRGESAGGGLAAALALLTRDRGGPSIVHQNLIYPMLDDRTCITHHPDHLGAFVWTAENNVYGWRSLLGDRPGAADVSPYAAPARATNLAGLPPTFIALGALDLFMVEDIDYARRLIEAAVPTELHVYAGAFHGFDAMVDAPPVQRMNNEAWAALRRALHGEA